MVASMGIEPTTFALSARRCMRISYIIDLVLVFEYDDSLFFYYSNNFGGGIIMRGKILEIGLYTTLNGYNIYNGAWMISI